MIIWKRTLKPHVFWYFADISYPKSLSHIFFPVQRQVLNRIYPEFWIHDVNHCLFFSDVIHPSFEHYLLLICIHSFWLKYNETEWRTWNSGPEGRILNIITITEMCYALKIFNRCPRKIVLFGMTTSPLLRHYLW